MEKFRSQIIKKPWITVTVVLSLIFMMIMIMKNRDRGGIMESEQAGINPQLEQLKEFWDLYRRATAFRIEGDWDNAIEEYEKALVLNPVHEDALYYLGNMYLEKGALEQAEKTWLELVGLNNNSARAHFQLGQLYMQPDSKALFDLGNAESEFKTTLAINSDFIRPLVHLGQISLYRGNLSQSMEFFTKVLVTDPENFESNLLVGFIWWKRGNQVRALDNFTKAYKSNTSEKPDHKISNEGDTFKGKSMERQISHSLFHTYLIELSELPGRNLSEEMELLYRRIDMYLNYKL